ncbi:MAG: hypothetical protein IJY73_04735 [Oscillospiraceae bacterium]|nr:hypothetical protein [Oscillospiraceae bacterium]
MQFENLEGIEFYTHNDDSNKIYVEYTIPKSDNNPYDIYKLVPITSRYFESYLRGIHLQNNDAYSSAKEVIEDITDFNNNFSIPDKIEPRIRTAGNLMNGLVEYSLCDIQRNCIKVTPNGWKIVTSPENKFIITSENQQQIKPRKTDENLLSLLDKYINTDKDSKILFIAWLVQAFCEGNHSALLIMADRGSGKSTLTKMIRKILDPSRTNSVVFPNKTDNLLTTLSNSYLVAFDNVAEIYKEASDVLCSAITGISYTKREFFTTNSMATFDLHNTVVMNGIDITPAEPDFAQRCLLLKLNKISSKKRKTDSDILTNFNKDLPYILGAIFNTLTKAMNIINNLKPIELPRMAESYLDMLAIATALGINEDEFRRIYVNNIATLDKARSNSDLVMAVKDYMNSISGKSIEGTVTKIYNTIRNATTYKSALPNSASHFSRKLRSEYATFSAVGLTVNIDDTYADGTHIKIIKRATD